MAQKRVTLADLPRGGEELRRYLERIMEEERRKAREEIQAIIDDARVEEERA